MPIKLKALKKPKQVKASGIRGARHLKTPKRRTGCRRKLKMVYSKMCLAIQGTVVEVNESSQTAKIRHGSITKEATTAACDQALKEGDRVLVQQGMIIEVMEPE